VAYFREIVRVTLAEVKATEVIISLVINTVFLFICKCSVVWYSVSDSLVRSELSYRRTGPDSDSCSWWTRYSGDSKTDPWDDP